MFGVYLKSLKEDYLFFKSINDRKITIDTTMEYITITLNHEPKDYVVEGNLNGDIVDHSALENLTDDSCPQYILTDYHWLIIDSDKPIRYGFTERFLKENKYKIDKYGLKIITDDYFKSILFDINF